MARHMLGMAKQSNWNRLGLATSTVRDPRQGLWTGIGICERASLHLQGTFGLAHRLLVEKLQRPPHKADREVCEEGRHWLLVGYQV